MNSTQPSGPLLGYTVGVTAARRREEPVPLLRRARAGTEADEHAVEAAIARLRGALGAQARPVRTVPEGGCSLVAAA
ncbi:hypothetical protein [Kitasatospora sp. GP82]|uniref:hypothetical protein n=1 Tax=Kitasatospora sp. GP82 TaxID=3035089 RepID=UPI002475C8A7|nr:hypothetical protein [Kitasatospora sp. GP82]MDH6127375.1 hypothetical protein [Kitasatospora sp. GP82]